MTEKRRRWFCLGILLFLTTSGVVAGSRASTSAARPVPSAPRSTASDRIAQPLLLQGEDGGGGPQILPEWWGLGGNASEASYIGLVELGVTLLIVGVVGYIAGKRFSVVPPRHRRRLLQAHESTMLVGVALTAPHFFTSEWAGTGFLVGVLFALEVGSGVYGRHLHRYVVRLGRRNEQSALFSSLFDVTNQRLFRRWRRIHVSLTTVTALVLAVHIVTATGG